MSNSHMDPTRPIWTQSQSPLLRIAYELRLSILSHLPLSPFDDCHESFGLYLCCRELRRELRREAVLRFNIHLQKLEEDSKGDLNPILADAASPLATVVAHSERSFHISASVSVGLKFEVTIDIPFLLPAVNHTWQYKDVPVFIMSRDHVKMVLNIRHSEERLPYEDAVQKLDFTTVKTSLFHLRLSSITVNLKADDTTALRIYEDEALRKKEVSPFCPCDYTDEIFDLSTRAETLRPIPLGRLIGVYVREFSWRSYQTLREYLEQHTPKCTAESRTASLIYEHQPGDIESSDDSWTTVVFGAKCTHGCCELSLDIRRFLVEEKFRLWHSFERERRQAPMNSSISDGTLQRFREERKIINDLMAENDVDPGDEWF
ncbi:hypothetical protein BU23DRAFT_564682 [Bimuria novae-zelandiae CBS 107.79]|uniref:Uncharacterized protein n=1 Tax=Bimuria novae-zelandiae CBS 107.79 TaxID=1447943 RepID=A0A6A5VMW1_9PLEO|nr:hypothetical protein BU23DRAFT_564682 [Bimuria novae-zelandiae CBS 107.79]